jgi:hypothetical protein
MSLPVKTLRIEPELWAKLQRKARAEGMSTSEAATRAIDEWVRRSGLSAFTDADQRRIG